jgi:hypothetical protein
LNAPRCVFSHCQGFTGDPKAALSARVVLAVDPWEREPDTRNGAEDVFFAMLFKLKPEYLPRQARDKHRKKFEQQARFLQGRTTLTA